MAIKRLDIGDLIQEGDSFVWKVININPFVIEIVSVLERRTLENIGHQESPWPYNTMLNILNDNKQLRWRLIKSNNIKSHLPEWF